MTGIPPKIRTLVIVGIFLDTLPRYFNFNIVDGRCFYYVGQALSFNCFIYSIYILVSFLKLEQTKIICELALWLSINNTYDELFGDPIHFGANEIIFALIVIARAFYLYRKVSLNEKT